jgi:curved DNA-binding protein
MANCKRQNHRETVKFNVVVHWDETGQPCSGEFRARDLSDGGIQIEGAKRIEIGKQVRIDVPQYGFPLEAIVRRSAPAGAGVSIGLEFCSETKRSMQTSKKDLDHYEVLQLSPRADTDTVHRVFRIMASRFHPDNPESGDAEKFILLTEAYTILSDPEKRAQYDAIRAERKPEPLPLFQARVFVDEKEGEAHRRLGVLCLLYAQRRRTPEHPSLSLLDIEALMGYPREYLEFTFWYLREKEFIKRTDCSDFALTVAGVDYVDEHMPAQSVLHRLIESGVHSQATSGMADGKRVSVQ